MRLRCSCWGLFLSMLLYSATAVAGESKTWAYLGWWLPDAWRSAPLGKIDRLLFFALKVDANGAIIERNGWPHKWGELRTALAQHGTPLDLTLTLFDVADFEQLFSSKQAQARLLDEATTLARHEAVAGLQLDVEIYSQLSPQLLESYAAFVRALSLGSAPDWRSRHVPSCAPHSPEAWHAGRPARPLPPPTVRLALRAGARTSHNRQNKAWLSHPRDAGYCRPHCSANRVRG